MHISTKLVSKGVAGLLAATTIFALSAQTHAATVVEVVAGGVKALDLAVPPAILQGADASAADEVVAALRWRMGFHGQFEVMPDTLNPERNQLSAEKPDLEFWKSSGAELLLQTVAKMEGKQLAIDVYVTDVALGKSVLSRRYKAEANARLDLADAIANGVLQGVAGIEPIFGNDIYFQMQKSGSRWREIYTSKLGHGGTSAVTKDQRFALKPRVDPSGRYLSYVGYKGNTADLYVLDLAKNDERRVRRPDRQAMGANWINEGTLVASAASSADPDLYKVSWRSNDWEPIIKQAGIDVSGDVSPDGKTMVYVSSKLGNPHLFLYDLGTRKETRLTLDGQYNAAPRWSPDGKWITFARREDGKFAIFAIRNDASELRRLTDNKGSDEDPTWAPDGRTILFSSDRGGATELHAVDLYTGKINTVTRLGGQARMPDIGRKGK